MKWEVLRGILLKGTVVFLLGIEAFGQSPDDDSLRLPKPGEHWLRILSPTLLELTRVTTKEPDLASVTEWNFVTNSYFSAPAPSQFVVTVGGASATVQTIGFKRRPIYAPNSERDLRIGNHLYLQLESPIATGAVVRVKNPSGQLWPTNQEFTAQADSLRWSPVIHINQEGYLPGFSKKAFIGFYLGSLGEMNIDPELGFRLVEAASSNVVFQGDLTVRRDVGYAYATLPYQNILEADFTGFTIPGRYRLEVPGLGASFPFSIHNGVAATFARTYALGLYHQRCGAANEFPFTRFVHGPCHLATAEVPTMDFEAVNAILANETENAANNPRHTAPPLQDVEASLYPFVNSDNVDVSGGHHDAGDYSKYTINSAQLIHALVFAADVFPGVGELDNLGLPESGDGKSDLLQEAKWEADFLARMQDADGGFYFLVYPRDRRYEGDVLPDEGDSQVVFPKTTAATAAAVAALAQISSSPLFKTQFPEAAATYSNKAILGWSFLTNAIALHGRDGSYQKITHYGDEFMHDDELAWAAVELFVATGNQSYQDEFITRFNPGDSATRRFTWWRLFEGYGCAIRSYAFAARSGRLSASMLDPTFLSQCESEIAASAADQVTYGNHNAYGSSFPDPNKPFRTAGWYFSVEKAFDLAVGYQLDAQPEYLEAVLENMNFEGGCNPLNVSFLTGLGYVRQREIVHQYAQNDRRVLPPSGIPLGNLQSGFAYLDDYGTELTALCFPSDGANDAPYAPYDRWADTFNTGTEFVNPQQARSLATMAFLMALTPLKDQPWTSASAQITGLPEEIPALKNINASLESPEIDLSDARIVWEARSQEPAMGANFEFAALYPGLQWVEAEAMLPDGRRVFATANFVATFPTNLPPNLYRSNEVSITADTVALYHLNGDFSDASGNQPALSVSGNAILNSENLGWMAAQSGSALRTLNVGDTASVAISRSLLHTPDTQAILLEAMIYVQEFMSHGRAHVPLVWLAEDYYRRIGFFEEAYNGPVIKGGTHFDFGEASLAAVLTKNQWHHLRVGISRIGYSVQIDGVPVAATPSVELGNWDDNGDVTLTLGNFDGWIDEVMVRNLKSGSSIQSSFERSGGYLQLRLSGSADQAFLIQSSSNLVDWLPAVGNTIATIPYIFSESITNSAARFLRVLPIP